MELDFEKLGFKRVRNPGKSLPDCVILLKRQTFNTNRAICVLRLQQLPQDLDAYFKFVRTKVAFKVGFFPIFWGLGLQVVLICPEATNLNKTVNDYVAKVDNQWAIIQSVFLVDPEKKEFIEGRTWGQFLTGKYQDEISKQLQEMYSKVDVESSL